MTTISMALADLAEKGVKYAKDVKNMRVCAPRPPATSRRSCLG